MVKSGSAAHWQVRRGHLDLSLQCVHGMSVLAKCCVTASGRGRLAGSYDAVEEGQEEVCRREQDDSEQEGRTARPEEEEKIGPLNLTEIPVLCFECWLPREPTSCARAYRRHKCPKNI
jgi:hypothetical protein